MTAPVSTYRLQIRESFTLRDAAHLVDYLHELGVDWVYLSPLLTAEKGSDHGYDVADTTTIDPARGGAAGLEALSAAAREHGMGVLVDIVPNHMGVADAAQNAWWWDVLTHGRESEYADAFDVDWDFGNGRLRIPVLGEHEDPPLTIEDGELRYYDHRFPLASGTADDGADPATVHSRQHYELVHWTRADGDLNYRRFFAVNTLAAIRVELPRVFDDSHAEIVRWFREGLVDGVRVDHPDGLMDPGAYLERLDAATGTGYLLVEKILENGEELPAHWPVDGTTGYDALAEIERVLVDPAGREQLDALEARLSGRDDPTDFAGLIRGTKRAIADGILRSEVLRLARDIERAGLPGDFSVDQLDDALAELLACFPVYRSYLPLGIEHLHEAAELARRHRPDLGDRIDALVPLLSDPAHPAAIRFQQTSGMVMAKGVEDTAFYRYARLASLTEVGGDPAEFSLTLEQFHDAQRRRQSSWPHSQTTLSTHDTKRGEDTRARITALAEIPDRWAATLDRLRELAPLGDGPLESILWSSIIGAWPASRERLHAYAEKASREAGSSTTWTAPNEEFEARMHALVDSAFDDERVTAILHAFVEQIAPAGWSNSLAAKLIQLTAPGVPDVYQGSELWETSLVDPDNRRPVDFDERRLLLAALDAGGMPEVDEGGAAKLLVTSRALRLRRDHPELFTRYRPLPAAGEASEHLVSFDRGGAITLATRLPLGLEERGGWGDTSIVLPAGHWIDVLTRRRHAGGVTRVRDVLREFPVALLAPVDAAHAKPTTETPQHTETEQQS
ncbi:(1-_4)-alpha-D-glucan 1-alpha-D-glucosylmutase [Diaminobutyricimonas aerilata]|uniref:(1->4)-alpha-D-glucan 1-alpha-D-glucosylmutase n=1 Tax=Diaminobutyricimonas aerilata TaxID=1162967 RepID=A0A2M9CIW7_9MICO|nr:malto-oligosyltrehalose synthase [Diaminobutyricimonas aerilata]PJJ71866.1 (1->4)-alpha-D-glucan 1-alpha-D-glucosylmutase [Diaminobutyricimonas aerilata]